MMSLQTELANILVKNDSEQETLRKIGELRFDHDTTEIADSVVEAHNKDKVDLISLFSSLQKSSGPNFFEIRRVFELALPRLIAPVNKVVNCVVHLIEEAGNDLAAGTVIEPFTSFLDVDPSRPLEAIQEMKRNSISPRLLTATLRSGAKVSEDFFSEATRLADSKNPRLREAAVFSLGKVEWPQYASEIYNKLVLIVNENQDDDVLMAQVISSIGALLKWHPENEELYIELLDKAAFEHGPYTLHSISQLFHFEFACLSNKIIARILHHLRKIKPENQGSIENLDSGLSMMLKQGWSETAITHLEEYVSNNEEVSLTNFEQTTRLLEDNERLSKLLTRWLLSTNKVLCKGLVDFVQKQQEPLSAQFDLTSIDPKDGQVALFLGHKAIGYFCFSPHTAASLVSSLLSHTTDIDSRKELARLLFDPLLICYPGTVSEYLSSIADDPLSENIEEITEALDSHEQYLTNLRATHSITELRPSEANIQAFNRRFSRQVSESFEEAQKNSPFLSIITKSVILYGHTSVHHVRSGEGDVSRQSIPLEGHSIEMEIPRLEQIDPFGLDYMLRVFRVEKLAK